MCLILPWPDLNSKMISFQSEVTALGCSRSSHESMSGIMAEIGRFNSEIKRTSALPWQVDSSEIARNLISGKPWKNNKNPQKSTISFTSSYIRTIWWWWCQLMLDDSRCMFNSIICWEPLAIWPWWMICTSFLSILLMKLRDFWRNVKIQVCSHELVDSFMVFLFRLSKSTRTCTFKALQSNALVSYVRDYVAIGFDVLLCKQIWRTCMRKRRQKVPARWMMKWTDRVAFLNDGLLIDCFLILFEFV